MWYYCIFFTFTINTISVPFDNGANIKGSRFAPKKILDNFNNLPIQSNTNINTNKNLRDFYSDIFFEVWDCIQKKNIPIIIGGDHSIVAWNFCYQ